MTAARLVEFIGFSAALALVWTMGWRIAAQVPNTPVLCAAVRRLMTPLVTLVTLSGLYKVVLLVADPFLGREGRYLYDWGFVLAILAAAGWVTLAGFGVGRQELPLDVESESDREPIAPTPLCPVCKEALQGSVQSCTACGAAVS